MDNDDWRLQRHDKYLLAKTLTLKRYADRKKLLTTTIVNFVQLNFQKQFQTVWEVVILQQMIIIGFVRNALLILKSCLNGQLYNRAGKKTATNMNCIKNQINFSFLSQWSFLQRTPQFANFSSVKSCWWGTWTTAKIIK